jgi:hypothetical protein
MKFSSAFLVALGLGIHSSDCFVPRGLPTFAVRSAVGTAQASRTALNVLANATAVPSVPAGFVPAPKETTVAAVPKVAQRWRKSTKQLITLGPASSSREMIEKLFLAGADVFRLNFSHGSQEQKKELLMTIREVEEKYEHPIGVLGDLQGPKLRVSRICSCLNVYAAVCI